ncbi:MAG: flagellar export protein FliJ [Deltaproteobacteria bacterium]|nr:flagellar export protein FliJ [Deltaproteobacteria bacterium]
MYRFNLQFLLDYRKRIEEGIQIELSHIQREMENERQLLISFKEEKNYYEEELVRREEKRIDVDEGILYRDYLKGMRIKIKKQREIVAKILPELDKKRDELLTATKKRKVLEKVREKDWKRFVKVLARSDGMFMDEIGIRKYQRGM